MKLETKQDIILNFIEQFQKFGPQVVDCFSNGMCYHFTILLQARFGDDCGVLYDPIINHFATEIDGRIYDITGDITDNSDYHFEYWASYKYKDPKETERIYRDCVYKVPSDIIICGVCPRSFVGDWGTLVCERKRKPVNFDDICQEGENL